MRAVLVAWLRQVALPGARAELAGDLSYGAVMHQHGPGTVRTRNGQKNRAASKATRHRTSLPASCDDTNWHMCTIRATAGAWVGACPERQRPSSPLAAVEFSWRSASPRRMEISLVPGRLLDHKWLFSGERASVPARRECTRIAIEDARARRPALRSPGGRGEHEAPLRSPGFALTRRLAIS
jgi:hypothetical protein